MGEMMDSNAKALKLNLDASAYGTFAEIGGGQEVSRWFFRVGGAAGTVAKTISAYDMAVSDAIYGQGERYVSRERVRSMLGHEFDLLVQRLRAARGDKTAFFAFADTVATRSFKGGNESHGWVGLRFQHAPGAEPSDILLHVALQDPTAAMQQQTLGVLGVNLIFGAYYLRGDHEGMLKSMQDGLGLENIEIDVVDVSGPAFEGHGNQHTLALRMLMLGLTQAVVFDDTGKMEQPSSALRKRALLIHRSGLKRDNPEMDHMFERAAGLVKREGASSEREPLRLIEMSINSVLNGKGGADELRSGIERAFRQGHAAILTSFKENYLLSCYLRRYSDQPIRFLFGLDALVTALRHQLYQNLTGGMLEALGRMLSPNTKLYVFSMPAGVFAQRLKMYQVEPDFYSVPEKPVLGVDDVRLAAPTGHLLEFLKSAGWVEGAG